MKRIKIVTQVAPRHSVLSKKKNIDGEQTKSGLS